MKIERTNGPRNPETARFSTWAAGILLLAVTLSVVAVLGAIVWRLVRWIAGG